MPFHNIFGNIIRAVKNFLFGGETEQLEREREERLEHLESERELLPEEPREIERGIPPDISTEILSPPEAFDYIDSWLSQNLPSWIDREEFESPRFDYMLDKYMEALDNRQEPITAEAIDVFLNQYLEAYASRWDTDAEGAYAELLILVGLRDPDADYDVGETPRHT